MSNEAERGRQESSPPPEDRFTISVVARMTGLSVHSLRTWEKRYTVVEPTRTETGRRLYSREDINRLNLIKALVDCGQAISTLAKLQTEQLVARLAEEKARRSGEATFKSPRERAIKKRVTVVGPQLRSRLGPVQDLVVVNSFADLAAGTDSPRLHQSDVLAITCPTIFAETARTILELAQRTGALRCVVIYEFAQNQDLEELRSQPYLTLIQGPASEERVLNACREAGAHRLRQPQWIDSPSHSSENLGVAPRIFTEQQLAKIAQISSAVQCECPQHLASLLGSLHAFEQYSRECENRSQEDAAIHSFLYQSAAQARSTMELALKHLVDAEGIRV